MRMCRKRKASSSRKLDRSGRMTSRRTSAVRLRSTAGASELGASSRTASRWKVVPATDTRASSARSSSGSRSRRAASSAWMVGGTGRPPASPLSAQPSCSRRRRPSSISMVSSSSANSGFPSQASPRRAAVSGGTAARLRRFATSSSVSSGPSASSRIEAAFSLPPPQPVRLSSSSGRAMHTSAMGASRARSATCSTRSRKVGSAHWRSSSTTTSGRRRATASNSLRTAQKIFSLVAPGALPRPIASATTVAT